MQECQFLVYSTVLAEEFRGSNGVAFTNDSTTIVVIAKQSKLTASAGVSPCVDLLGMRETLHYKIQFFSALVFTSVGNRIPGKPRKHQVQHS